MSASVCSTESCTRAATSARSSVRMRAERSASRSSASRQTHGPHTSTERPPRRPGRAAASARFRSAAAGSRRSPQARRRHTTGARRAGSFPLTQREREAGRDEHDSRHAALGDAEGAQQERAGDHEQEDRPARAIRRRPRPDCEVEHDAGPARERESAKTSRTSVTSTPSVCAIPAQTPARARPSASRGEGTQRHP